MTYQKKARLFVNIILILVFASLLWMGLIPFGTIKYSYDFSRENAFISPLRPDLRLLAPENGTQKIIADPVYFNLHTPRKMKEAELEITFKSDGDQAPIFEAGVMVDSVLWRYDLKPVQNKIVENICGSWNKAIEGNNLFCQKEKNFNTIEEFLASTTDSDSLAVYNYNLTRDYIIEDYLPTDEVVTIDYPLIGAYQFYTYIKNETLNYQFSFLDQNKNRDEDKIDLNIYYNDILIDTRHLPDDGNNTDNQKESEVRLLDLKIPNLPEGIYKIELRVNNDIITKQIKTTQQITSFDKKIPLASRGLSDITIYTDSQKIEAITTSPESLQSLAVNGFIWEIDETFKQFSYFPILISSSTSIHEIVLDKDGLAMSGNGVFGFEIKHVLNPQLKKADSNLNISDENLKYILAGYSPTDSEGEWQRATINIDLESAYRENRSYSFILSVPGLNRDAGQSEYVELDKIEIRLKGDNIFRTLKNKLK